MFRDSINTDSLQQKFSATYRDFFINNELVLSTNIDIPILHDNSTRFRGVAIKQKIPLKVYCGIQITQFEPKYTFYFFDAKNQSFTCSPLEDVFENFPAALNHLQKEMGIAAQNFNIEVMSEASRGMGFDVSPKLGILIPLIFTIFFKENEHLFQQLKRQDVSSDNQKEILKLATHFLSILRKDDVSIIGMTSVFEYSQIPHYCLHQKPLQNLLEFNNDISVSDFTYGSLGDMFQIQEKRRFYDYYYIYTGKNNPIINFRTLHSSDKAIIDSGLEKIPERFQVKSNDLMLTESLYADYLRLLYNLSFKFTETFGSFLENPLNLAPSIKILNQYATIKKYIETEQNEITNFLEQFDLLLKKRDLKNYGLIYNASFRKGGCAALITEFDVGRDIIIECLEEIKKDYPAIELSYISFIDGVASQGVVIEKWPEKEISSIYDSKQHTFLRDWNSSRLYADSSDSDGIAYDLLLDRIKNKIYINGECLSSKELHSQRATIDILALLLDRLEQEVPNSSLPVSSYSQSKNEIQGKIVLPIVKLIQTKTGRPLLLSCKGSNTKFYLKLMKNNLRIGVLSNR